MSDGDFLSTAWRRHAALRQERDDLRAEVAKLSAKLKDQTLDGALFLKTIENDTIRYLVEINRSIERKCEALLRLHVIARDELFPSSTRESFAAARDKYLQAQDREKQLIDWSSADCNSFTKPKPSVPDQQ
jgi:hypothetical protein